MLATRPEFAFDLGEHLESLNARDALGKRWGRYLRWRAEGPSAYADPSQRLADWLQSEAAREVPAYAGAASGLGLIDKGTIRRRGSEFVSRASAGQTVWRRSTSGTTGAPVTFLFDRDRHFEQLILAVPKIVVRAGAVAAFRRSTLCLHVTDTQVGGNSAFADPLDRFGTMLRGRIDQAKPGGVARVAEWLRDLRPGVVTARPEIFAVMLAEPAVARELETHPPDLLVSSGSELSAGLRVRLAEQVAAPIAIAYGLCEFGVVASSCPVCGHLHLDDPNIALELGGPTNDEAILSGFGNAAMPLLRYRTGDRLQLTQERCESGAPGPTIVRVVGRVVPAFRFAGGRVFSPTHFTSLLDLFPIREYQLTQVDLDSVELRVEPRAGAAAEVHGLLGDLRSHLEAGLPGGVAVEVRSMHFGDQKVARFRTLCSESSP
ncbi:MAG TPA: hypothetical protein VHR18_09895 [Solirubrobacterales bacterium]|nr:hypothetical protein [Solirubrobacterales bacterium]